MQLPIIANSSGHASEWRITMNPARRRFLQLAADAAALPVLVCVAKAQVYPSRPVRIIVCFPPGIAADIIARLMCQRLSERFGQQFVVDNRPGAGGDIGAEAVARAPADGYTLLLASSANAISFSLHENPHFNFARDIAPVAIIGVTPFVMVVNPSVPAKTLPEFIGYAKANPGKINMASPGVGSGPHVVGELFKMMAGVDLVHVPYRSSFFPDLLGGQVQVAFGPVAQLIEYIRNEKLRALAVTTRARLKVLPNIPTVSEFLPGYEANGWYGIGTPNATPMEIISKLNDEINAILADPNMKTRLAGLGTDSISMTPSEFGRFIADEVEKWAQVVKFARIKLD